MTPKYIPPPDIQAFLNQLRIDGKSQNTIISYGSFLKKSNEWKPLINWTKDDVDKYCLLIREKKSFEYIKLVLKLFFRFHKKDITDHIRAKIKSDITLEEKDILNTDEINRMIETTNSLMYKALLAFCFESGARISEILKVKVGDIQETNIGMVLSVYETKKGKLIKRKGLYIFSAEYIRNYINSTTKTKTDLIFDITKNAAYKAFKRIEIAAGIEKKSNPHAFRHAQATDMVRRGYQETIIRKKLGWTPTSPMIARYEHIVDDDVLNATLEKSGLDIPKKPITNIKMAEPLKIADAAASMRKISEDNEAIKKELEEKDAKMDAKIKEMEAKMERMQKLFSHRIFPSADGTKYPVVDKENETVTLHKFETFENADGSTGMKKGFEKKQIKADESK